MTVCIDGMSCTSCEITIERAWNAVEGICSVKVDSASGEANIVYEGPYPTVSRLQKALEDTNYMVSLEHQQSKKDRPSWLELAGLFVLVFALGLLASSLGWLKPSISIGAGTSLAAVFVIGLVAASSSCIAVAGGLLLSSVASFTGRRLPTVLFVLGRIAGYTVFGGLLGVLGSAIAISPAVTALLTILAAIYMIVAGLDLLHLTPAWLKRLTPKLPKALSNRILDEHGNVHPIAPFALGAATFFLPCGFTQALQLYALTTGSFAAGAATLGVFSLGTAPALLALGWAAGSLKGRAGLFFTRFSGALVIVLGLWNIQNGLAIAGYPLQIPSTSFAASAGSSTGVSMEGNTQVMKMSFNNGYTPDAFTLKAGLPTRWVIDGTKAVGCASVLVSRQLRIQKLLSAGLNTIEFTAPAQPGTYSFSCSMGMYRGQINVIPNT